MNNQWPPLYQFARVSMDEKLDELAALARKEKWSYRYASTDYPYPVLYNYVQQTFARVQQQDKIAYNREGNAACFNTGLITEHNEQIYGYFVPNRFPERFSQSWFLAKFTAESDRDLLGMTKPPRATYMDHPQDLVFDGDRELVIDVDHLVRERFDRFPGYLQDRGLYFVKTCLTGSFQETAKLLSNGDLRAVPQFFAGKIQFLLPLFFQSSEYAEVVLAVEPMDYVNRVNTLLTVDMAYNNARLLGRVDAGWLAG